MLNPRSKTANGALGERLALRVLQECGYKVLARNFRSRFGEVDIVALKDGALVFVEVKMRRGLRFGSPEEAVTKRKLQRVVKAGQYYSLLHPELPKKQRIAVVALEIAGEKILSSKVIDVLY